MIAKEESHSCIPCQISSPYHQPCPAAYLSPVSLLTICTYAPSMLKTTSKAFCGSLLTADLLMSGTCRLFARAVASLFGIGMPLLLHANLSAYACLSCRLLVFAVIDYVDTRRYSDRVSFSPSVEIEAT